MLAIERGGARRGQALQLLALELELALLEPVLGEHRAIGIDDDDVARAVDDEQLVVLDQRARIVRGDDRRHVEAARDDRRVRGDAAQVGEKRREAVVLELDHVGGRKIVRDEDGVLLGIQRPHRRPAFR